MDPSPSPWTFATHMYGIAHCLIDRDGRVIGCNLPIGNGPLLERIDSGREREPGEDLVLRRQLALFKRTRGKAATYRCRHSVEPLWSAIIRAAAAAVSDAADAG